MDDDGEARARIIDAGEIDRLIGLLRGDGYTVIGPSVRDGVIVSAEIDGAAALPAGWTARQEPGSYRLERRGDAALFGHAVGPQSARATLHPSRLKLWGARRDASGDVVVDEPEPPPPRYAFLGLRGCELHAIAVQDRVFLSADHADPDYAARRRGAFVVAIDCLTPAATCFCTSMGGDPGVAASCGDGNGGGDALADLILTELLEDGPHRFLVRAASAAGRALLARLEHRAAGEAARGERERLLARSRSNMGRTFDTRGLKRALQANPEHRHWQDVGERCLGCTNCTLVCPTCFCTSVEDVGDLAGERVERWRRDDSCFTLDFSYLYGGSVRVSSAARYRQWLTHKLAHWIDQFERVGCVGCGRCSTWCPVGIDIVEEARAIAAPGPDARTAAPGSSATAPSAAEPSS